MILGFSGTRMGMTAAQEYVVADFIRARAGQISEVHHGCCVGADAEFHALIRRHTSAKIIGHPPISEYQLHIKSLVDYTSMADCDQLYQPADYLVRDDSILAVSEYMLFTPRTREPQQRGSGTWYCIRHWGEEPRTIVYPTGSVEYAE